VPQRFFLIIVFILGLTSPATSEEHSSGASAAAADPDDHLYIIYDSSGSMWGELSDKSRKYEAGRTAMSELLETDLADRSIAFRAYGHRQKGDCRDSELIVPFSKSDDAESGIKDAIANIRPTGKTPISYSLREALKDFDDRKGDILLISDGLETCDIDPCALMSEWREADVKIRVHVVGVGLDEIERQAMMCVAETGGGTYFDAGSEDEFQDALTKVSEIEPGEPEPVQQDRGYGLSIQGLDETGRSFPIIGTLLDADGQELMDLTSNGQHWLEDGPGEYTMTVGVLLRDGTIYKPVTETVTIDTVGSKRVDVLITRPAIVSATFTENGEEHRGSQVYAYQDGKEVFSFRARDEALARPGAYEFRSKPNADNELSIDSALVEGEHTIIEFELINTVEVQFKYVLPDGNTDQRGGELLQNDTVKYSTYSGRPSLVVPGTYILRDKGKDPLNQMEPREVTVTAEENQTIELLLDAGYVLPEYAGNEFDMLSKGGYIYVHAIDPETGESIGSETARPGRPEVVKPGSYRVIGNSNKGYFDSVDVTVESGQTVTATVTAKPVAAVSMTYAPGDYERTPDRATLVPLDGQKPIKTYMGIGKELKVPPGRYRIDPHSYTPEATSTPEFTLEAGETRAIVIPRK